MATIQIEAFLVWHKDEWMDKGEWILSWSDMSCLGVGYVCAGKRVVSVEAPDSFDPRPIQIANLRMEQERVRAEAQAKVNNMEEQIQRLLCIEAPKDDAEVIL